jgi:hypothetical protein
VPATATEPDHHTAYLARALAALSPEGHARVDELLEQLAQAAGGHEWLVRFAKVREHEADSGQADTPADSEPARNLTDEELDRLTTGLLTIRDTEPLDDVADWANAVIALLTDTRDRGFIG